MAKKSKTDASTAALKLAYAKVLDRHAKFKVALIKDVLASAAEAEKADAGLELLNTQDEAPVN